MKSSQGSLRILLASTFLVGVVILLAARTQYVLNVPADPGEIDTTQWGLHDFRDAIYYPCRSFAEGHDPYDSSDHFRRYPVGQLFPLYSPLTLVLHQPLSWLPFHLAQWLYFGLTILLTMALAALTLRCASLRINAERVLWIGGLLLLSRPGHMNLVLGQSTAQVALFTIMALFWATPHPWRSGFVLALATFKPTFGAPLFLLMLARRNVRAAIYGLTIGCLLTLPIFGYLFWLEGGVGEFAEVLTSNSDTFDAHEGRDPATSFSRLDAYVLVCKLSGSPTHNWIELGFAFAITGFTGLTLFRLSGVRPGETRLSFCLILLTLLVAIYHHAYDWLLLAPIVAMLLYSPEIQSQIPKSARVAGVVLLLVPALNFFSTNSFKALIDNDSYLWLLITSLNAISLFLAWLIIFAAAWKAGNRQSNQATP